MQTHVKDALTTLVTFLVLIGTVHAGIWFRLFGIPDITVLNWPFHYFWFVIGAWITIMVVFLAYNRYVATTIDPEKRRLRERHQEASDPTETADERGVRAGGE